MNKHGFKSQNQVENMFDSSEMSFKLFSRKNFFPEIRENGWKILTRELRDDENVVATF